MSSFPLSHAQISPLRRSYQAISSLTGNHTDTLFNIMFVSRFGRGLSNPSQRFSLVIVFARQISDTDNCFFDH